MKPSTRPPFARLARALSLLLAIALSGAAGCGGEESAPAGEGGARADLKVFTDARRSEHKSLDPPRQFDGASSELIMNVYDTLLEYHYLARPYRVAPNLVREVPVKQADGKTYREALGNAEQIIEEWIETATELGRPIPQPRGRLAYA